MDCDIIIWRVGGSAAGGYFPDGGYFPACGGSSGVAHPYAHGHTASNRRAHADTGPVGHRANDARHAYRHPSTHGHAYPDLHAYAHCNPHAHPDKYAYAHGHAYPDIHTSTHGHAYPDIHTSTHGHIYPDRYLNACSDCYIYPDRYLNACSDCHIYPDRYPNACSDCHIYSDSNRYIDIYSDSHNDSHCDADAAAVSARTHCVRVESGRDFGHLCHKRRRDWVAAGDESPGMGSRACVVARRESHRVRVLPPR